MLDTIIYAIIVAIEGMNSLQIYSPHLIRIPSDIWFDGESFET